MYSVIWKEFLDVQSDIQLTPRPASPFDKASAAAHSKENCADISEDDRIIVTPQAKPSQVAADRLKKLEQ